ncbi:MAG: peptidylprolyl isomerase [Candidatus Zipacnadales bacterium]
MGFVQLKQRIRHAIRPLFYAFVVIFLIGGAFSFGTYHRSERQRRGGASGKREVPKYLATVNGKRIPRADLDNYLWMLEDRYSGLPVDARRQVITSWFEMRVNEVIFSQAISEEGIRVSGKEIRAKRKELLEQELAPELEERRALLERLKREKLTLDEYRAKRLREFAQSPQGSDAAIEDMLARQKLQEKIQSTVQVTDEDVVKSYEEIRARHILIKPEELKAKAVAPLDTEKAKLERKIKAAREKGVKPDAKWEARLKEIETQRASLEAKDWDFEAEQKAESLLKKVKAGANFAKLAQQESHCPSASKGGDLDYFRRGQMAKEFEEVAFGLKTGEISGVVKTDFGYHIIKVEAKRRKLPEDYEKEKKMYREQYINEQKWRVWSDYEKKLRDSAQIDVHDPELAAYRLLDEKPTERDKAIQLLDQALQQDADNLGAKYELAKLWQAKGQLDKALQLMLEIEAVEGADRSVELLMTIGDLLRDKDRDTEALARYKKASDLAAPVKQQNRNVHFRLLGAYENMGQKELAKQEQDWLDRLDKAMQEQGGPWGSGGTFTLP